MTLLLAGMLPMTSSIFHARYDNPLRGECRFLAIPMPTLLNDCVSLRVEARGIPRKESAKIRNRRMRRKFNGSPTKPRLSVFCSTRQLYAMLVDDHNKKTLFYASTLQNSMREDPPCSTIEAAQRVGEALVHACTELQISEISAYDRNGFARGERMQAFEVPIAQYGLLTR
ncbi:hypothetical protein IEQ34_011323 [Dendrobium chrysotoxum]|uniref:50S ribosomal protein L18, chloroplastic n=1 Tax=Dendrobium chrysotoxum TaxID=161865 RepID=A0AAV7GX70_DENCH|nr:hypothetical protein IEQ34_011323 [Dendrobium chrysotoxum]